VSRIIPQGPKRIFALGCVIFVFCLGALALAAIAKAAPADAHYPQPAVLGWNANFSPASYYVWNGHMTYLFSLSSRSAQVQHVTVEFTSWDSSSSNGPWNVRTLHYTLQAWQTIPKIRYDVLTPPGPSSGVDDSWIFEVQAEAFVEGYPSNTISTYSYLDRGK